MVERRGRCGEYGRETGRRAYFQARLFETSLVALSIPWVNGQSINEREVMLCCRCRPSYTRPFQIWYVTQRLRLSTPYREGDVRVLTRTMAIYGVEWK